MDFMKLDIQLFGKSDGEIIIETDIDTKNFEKGINDMKKTSKEGFTVMKGVMANMITGGVMSAINGIKEIGSAIVDVGKQAISNYADYEQLTGGIETLFKDSADKIKGYAENAYKTAGLSANEYMNTVTSFSASLISSLGGDTEKAANYANRAVTDMSDNANKMGTDIGMIQNAYQGFAKQNYTMLDNLKLGYGGTKEEMERLIKDASKMTDVQDELNVSVQEGDMSFSNIVDAISVVQKNMDITDTTFKEASHTISGSFNSMKSSWTNLLTGLANGDADIPKLLNQFIDSVGTFGKNLLPAIKAVLENAKDLIKELIPKFAQKLPSLLNEVVPPLVSYASELINTLIDTLISMLPDIIDAGVDLLLGFIDSFVDNIDKVIDTAFRLIDALINGLLKALPKLIEKAPVIIDKLVTKLTDPEMTQKIYSSAFKILTALTVGLIKAIPQLAKALTQIQSSILNGLRNMLSKDNFVSMGKGIVQGIWSGVSNGSTWLKDKIRGWVGNIKDFLKKMFKIGSPSKLMRDEIGIYLAQGVGVGFTDELSGVYASMQKAIDFENAKLQGNVEMGKVFNTAYASTPITVDLDASVEMDNQKVGRLVASSVMQTVKTKGGY